VKADFKLEPGGTATNTTVGNGGTIELIGSATTACPFRKPHPVADSCSETESGIIRSDVHDSSPYWYFHH
jgi:hypothetical protein